MLKKILSKLTKEEVKPAKDYPYQYKVTTEDNKDVITIKSSVKPVFGSVNPDRLKT